MFTDFKVFLLSLPLLVAAGCGGGGGGGGGAAPPPPPAPSPLHVSSVTPAADAAGVPLGTPIRIAFDRDLDPATLTPATISVRTGGAPVSGSLRYATPYEVTVSTGVRDTSGNPLGSAFVSRFTTEAAPSSPLEGVLCLDGNAGVSYNALNRVVTLDMNAVRPLAGIVVKAVQPSIDNHTTLLAEENAVAEATGAFHFPALTPGRWLLVAEGIFPAGPVRRILGVSSTNALGAPILHYVPMKDVTPDPAVLRLDPYCLDCHPTIDNVTRPGQIYRDAHVSGVVPVNANKPTGTFDAYGRVTCESCHTLHYPTGFGLFVKGSYATLCNSCH